MATKGNRQRTVPETATPVCVWKASPAISEPSRRSNRAMWPGVWPGVLTTWPEHRLLLIDTLLCNAEMDADVAVDEIVRRLCPAGEVVRQRIRIEGEKRWT